MPEEVTPWAGVATWVGLAGFVVVSIVKGWLVPKNTVDKLISSAESRIRDRDDLIKELRAENAALDARNDLLASQVRELVAVGHTQAQVVRTIADVTTGGGPDPPATGGSQGKETGRAKAGANQTPRRRGRGR